MNKKVRLCLVKIFENGNYFYKIEGALFIVSILNSSKAFGYHLKKQGGQTLGEYNLVINANVLDENYKKNEATSDSIFDEQCSCGSDYLLKECCLNLEWDTDVYDLGSSEYESAFSNSKKYKAINDVILEMRSKYMIADGEGFLCPKVFEENLTEFDNMYWLEESDEVLETEFKLNLIDIERVSGKVPGNMLFMY
ncbi:hypothetical protein N8387_02370 [Polaribacter sp.]|nr:hypothetical protein [Polaribacter sp.]